MRLLSQKFVFGSAALLVASLITYFFWLDQSVLSLFPIGLLLIFFAIYQTEKLFLAIGVIVMLGSCTENSRVKSFGFGQVFQLTLVF